MAGDTLSSRRRTSDQNAPSDLLERDAELEQIAAPLRGALDGSGGSVVIEGAPGIGKTSLLEKAAELAQADGMTPLRARGGVMESEFALGVMLQLLAPSIEELSGDERESVFSGAAGLARALFEEVPDRAAADDRLLARFHGLHWLCVRLAEERPLSLSPQERRVAAMATEGLGNREIAEALFLTRRTVEMHLTGVYRKLGVSGRRDLPAALAAWR